MGVLSLALEESDNENVVYVVYILDVIQTYIISFLLKNNVLPPYGKKTELRRIRGQSMIIAAPKPIRVA